jgi:hypothetical protein
MKGPYPEIIFHFADKAAALKGILKEQAFFPSYARERIENLLGPDKEFGVPMVSFCDLRLSELPVHMEKYGHFGIGLTKEWALRSQLNPVAYVNKSSEFTSGLLRAIDWLWEQFEATQDDYRGLVERQLRYMDTMNTLRYIKNYEGTLIRRRHKPRNYRFADEREWRHVLHHATPNVLAFLSPKLMGQKDFFNAQLRPFKLPYSPADVKYLLVPSEAQIPALRKTIESLGISLTDQSHLLARIITSEQVETDF